MCCRGPKGIAATIDWRSSSLAAEEGPARAEPDQAAAPDHVPPGGGGASSDADAGASVQRVGSGIASIPRQSSGPKPAAPAPTGGQAGFPCMCRLETGVLMRACIDS